MRTEKPAAKRKVPSLKKEPGESQGKYEERLRIHRFNQAYNRYLEAHESTVRSQMPFFSSEVVDFQRQSTKTAVESPLSARLNVNYLTFGKPSEQINAQQAINAIVEKREEMEFENRDGRIREE